MNPLRLVLCALTVACAQHAAAVQPAGAIPPSRSGPAEGEQVERGGTIDGVDPGKPAILVDGVAYGVVRGLHIHLASNRLSTSLGDLHRGMQIRFTTVKEHGGQQMREIWVTGVRR